MDPDELRQLLTAQVGRTLQAATEPLLAVRCESGMVDLLHTFDTFVFAAQQKPVPQANGIFGVSCGAPLLEGDPAFVCLDCSQLCSSVLCANCFMRSEHRRHRYRWNLTGICGDLCDCGSCSEHRSRAVSPFPALPSDTVARFNALTEQLLRLGLDAADGAAADVLDSWLTPTMESPEFAVVLLADGRLRRFALAGSLGLQPGPAVAGIAAQAEAEGRAVAPIKGGRNAAVAACADLLAADGCSCEGRTAGLRSCWAEPARRAALRFLAHRLLAWLADAAARHPDLHNALCDSLLSRAGDSPPAAERLLLSADRLWRGARRSVAALLNRLLARPESRRQLAEIWLARYAQLLLSRCDSDHSGDGGQSIMRLCSRALGSVELSRHLLTNRNALAVILHAFKVALIGPGTAASGPYEPLDLPAGDRRSRCLCSVAELAFSDAERLLRSASPSTTDGYSFVESIGISSALPALLDACLALQDAGLIRRLPASGPASPLPDCDIDWEAVQRLDAACGRLVILLVSQLSAASSTDCAEALQVAMDRLRQSPPDCATLELPDDPDNRSCSWSMRPSLRSLLDGRVGISQAQPLARLVGALAVAAGPNSAAVACAASSGHSGWEAAVATWLRQLAWSGQAAAGLWRRGGVALGRALARYAHEPAPQLLDIRALQAAAAAAPQKIESFAFRLLDAFEVLGWVHGEDRSGGADSDGDETAMRAGVEEALRLLLSLATLRRLPEVSPDSSAMDAVEEELTARLIITADSLPHSDLVEVANSVAFAMSIGGALLTHSPADIYAVIRRVAEPSPSNGEWRLRGDAMAKVCPGHPRLTRASLARLLDCQPNLPPLPPLSKAYAPLRRLLVCEATQQVVLAVLERCVRSRVPRLWSEAQVERSLLLLICGLREAADAVQPRLLSTLSSLPRSHLPTGSMAGRLLDIALSQAREFCSEAQLKASVHSSDVANSSVATSVAGDVDSERIRRLRIDAARRTALARMAAQQKLFSAGLAAGANVAAAEAAKPQMAMTTKPMRYLLGSRRLEQHQLQWPSAVCIVCQADEPVALGSSPLVCGCLVQLSTALSGQRGQLRPAHWPNGPVEADLLEGVHVSSCGHAFHLACCPQIPQDLRGPSGVFHCPLCRQACNNLLPLIPPLPAAFPKRARALDAVDVAYDDWLEGLRFTVANAFHFTGGHGDNSTCRLVPVSLAGLQQRLSTAIGNSFSGIYTVRCERPPDPTAWLEDNDGQLLGLIDKLSEACDQRMCAAASAGDFQRRLASLPLALAYSLNSLEAEDDDVRDRRHRCRHRSPALQQLARAAALLVPAGESQQQQARELALAHLLLLLPAADGRRLCPLSLRQADLLSSQIALTYLLPYLYLRDCRPRPACTTPVCAGSEACLARLFYTARLVQVFLALPARPDDDGEDAWEAESQLDQLVTSYRFAAGIWSSPAASGLQLAAELRSAVAPFLRSSVRFFHCLVGEDSDDYQHDIGLVQADGYANNDTELSKEFSHLAELLRLPVDPCELFAASPSAADLASHWCLDPRLECRQGGPTLPPLTRSLTPLPDDYSELLLLLASPQRRRCCPDIGGDCGIVSVERQAQAVSEPVRPALCLLCGRIVCAACCRVRLPDGGRPVGAAGAHVRLCGGGAGVFLRLASVDLLLVAPAVGAASLAAAPYVDRLSGEAARPGRPLALDAAALKRLRADWLGHRLAGQAAAGRQCADLGEP